MTSGDRRPLVLTREPALRGELERLCAGAALVPDLLDSAALATARWSSAPGILVGADCAGDVAAAGLRRRTDIVLVASVPETVDTWRAALSIHADQVCVLPVDRRVLASYLVELGDRDGGAGVVVGVIAGRGGAGSSTYAVSLAREAARVDVRTILLDGDPLGGGLELVIGCEDIPGLRWPEVAAAGGQISAAALRSALPTSDGLAVLSSTTLGSPGLDDVEIVVAAARRGADLVVVDLPRRLDEALRTVVSRLDTVIVVTTPDIRAVAGARHVVEALRPGCDDVRVAVRTAPAQLVSPADVAESVGRPLAGAFSTRRATQRAIDEGCGPALRLRDRRQLRRLLHSLLHEQGT